MARDQVEAEIADLAWNTSNATEIDPADSRPTTRRGLRCLRSINVFACESVSDSRPIMQPRGAATTCAALAGQRRKNRFLTFQDAKAAMLIIDSYGKGEVMKAIFNTIQPLARDVAAMEC